MCGDYYAKLKVSTSELTATNSNSGHFSIPLHVLFQLNICNLTTNLKVTHLANKRDTPGTEMSVLPVLSSQYFPSLLSQGLLAELYSEF